MKAFHIYCFALLLSLAAGIALAAPALAAEVCTLDRATGTVIEKEPWLKNAYGARWNHALNRVVFMQPGENGYYRIFTMNPDGSGKKPMPAVTTKHQGVPYWHPSGRYFLFTAEKESWKSRQMFGSPDYEAMPGFGRHDDLWLMTPDGRKNWQLTAEANTKDEGVLVPVFSPDGNRLAWSSRQDGGKYVLKVADFVEKPEPHLENIKSYLPGAPGYYETGSFTSDSRGLTFTSDMDSHSFWHSQIYLLDLGTGKSTRLTTGNDYNEHPTVVKTPTGDRIVYMSTRGVDRYPWQFFLGTDWYAVKPDGSGVKRLTEMNVRRKGNPQNSGSMQVGCTVAVSPTGDMMLGDVQDSLTKQTGMIRVVHLTCDNK